MSHYNEIAKLIEQLKDEVEHLRDEAKRNPVPVDNLGAVVKTVRKEQGLTQAELADLAGIGEATLKRIESGNKDVTFSNILHVLDVLGVGLWIG